MKHFLVGFVALLAVAGCSSGSASEPVNDPLVVAGASVFGRSCEVCHGRAGAGGIAPALSANVLSDFPSCADHLQWVMLGTEEWKAEVGNEVGSSGREITGAMPAFSETLSAEEIREVVLYERVALAGGDSASEIASCQVD